MKILFLNLYSGAIERGAESFAHSLAGKLIEVGYQVELVKGKSDQIPDDGFRGSLLGRLKKRFFLDRAGRAVLRFSLSQIVRVWRGSYDLVIPLNGFWQVLILKLIQPFKQYKILITGNSGPGWDERWNLYLRPDVFVATTGPMQAWARNTCPWTRVELIPYGIERNWGRVKKGIQLDSTTVNSLKRLEKPIILCPSALVPYKRVDLAIKAVSKLDHGSLVVVGKGELEKDLTKLGNQLLPSRFLLTSVPYELMPLVYQIADLVTLPSSPQENSPMVFVEALACGKKVVATDAPRVRWALDKAGFYVNPENLDEYAAVINQALLAYPDLKQPLAKFLWPRVLGKYVKLMTELTT